MSSGYLRKINQITILVVLVFFSTLKVNAYINFDRIENEFTSQSGDEFNGPICDGVQHIQNFSNRAESLFDNRKILNITESLVVSYQNHINDRISHLTHFDSFDRLQSLDENFRGFSECLFSENHFRAENLDNTCMYTGPQFLGNEEFDMRLEEIKTIRTNLISYQRRLRGGENIERNVGTIPRSCQSLRSKYLNLVQDYPSYFYSIQKFLLESTQGSEEEFTIYKNSIGSANQIFSSNVYEFLYSPTYVQIDMAQPPIYEVPSFVDTRFITLSYEKNIIDEMLRPVSGNNLYDMNMASGDVVAVSSARVEAETNICDESLSVGFRIKFISPQNTECRYTLDQVVSALNNRCETLNNSQTEQADSWQRGTFCEDFLKYSASDTLYRYIINSFYRGKGGSSI